MHWKPIAVLGHIPDSRKIQTMPGKTSVPSRRCICELPDLTPTENALYQALLNGDYGEASRLEQERIPPSALSATP